MRKLFLSGVAGLTCLLAACGGSAADAGPALARIETDASARAAPVAAPLTDTLVVSRHGRFVAIAAGGSHSCALDPAGAAWCWGGNTHLQLGAETESPCRDVEEDGTEVRLACSATPVRVPGDIPFRAVSAGASHSCGLAATGAVWCWGAGLAAPTRVPGDVQLAMIALSSLGTTACGVAADGTAHCWPLPLGAAAKMSPPGPIPGPVRFASVAPGTNSVCGISVQGAAHCWGYNSSGQLGIASPDEREHRGAPTEVAIGEDVLALAVGAGSACAITGARFVMCWGGKYGDAPSEVTATPGWWRVGAGNAMDCALGPGGRASCWAGAGDRYTAPEPEPVSDAPAFAELAVGWGHACALTAEGDAYCWGLNDMRQLGAVTEREQKTPVRVEELPARAP